MSKIGTPFKGTAADIRVGDFLTRDGFRRVCGLTTQYAGRGRKRAPVAAVVEYVDGSTVSVPYLETDKHGSTISTTIYRQETTTP